MIELQHCFTSCLNAMVFYSAYFVEAVNKMGPQEIFTALFLTSATRKLIKLISKTVLANPISTNSNQVANFLSCSCNAI